MTFLPHRIRYYGFWRCFCHENYLRYTRPQDGIPKRIINYIITHMKYMYHSCEKDIQIFLSSKHIVDANPSQWFPTFRESTLPHTHRYIYIYSLLYICQILRTCKLRCLTIPSFPFRCKILQNPKWPFREARNEFINVSFQTFHPSPWLFFVPGGKKRLHLL